MEMAEGPVVLGGNEGASSMYTVIIGGSAVEPPQIPLAPGKPEVN